MFLRVALFASQEGQEAVPASHKRSPLASDSMERLDWCCARKLYIAQIQPGLRSKGGSASCITNFIDCDNCPRTHKPPLFATSKAAFDVPVMSKLSGCFKGKVTQNGSYFTSFTRVEDSRPAKGIDNRA